MKKFKARLASRGPGAAWTFLEIPFSVEKAFGSKARVPVAGTINGFAFRNSLLPQGDGTHAMAVSKALQAGANARAGDLVSVSLEVDRSGDARAPGGKIHRPGARTKARSIAAAPDTSGPPRRLD
jgi:hypothetical protein